MGEVGDIGEGDLGERTAAAAAGVPLLIAGAAVCDMVTDGADGHRQTASCN